MRLTQPEIIQILRKRAGLNQAELGSRAFDTTIDSGRTKIKNLAYLGNTSAVSTADGCTVIPIPTVHALAQTLDQGPHIPDFLTSNDSKGGDKMDKKTVIFFSLFALLIIE